LCVRDNEINHTCRKPIGGSTTARIGNKGDKEQERDKALDLEGPTRSEEVHDTNITCKDYKA
jgi:hypothetical protein